MITEPDIFFQMVDNRRLKFGIYRRKFDLCTICNQKMLANENLVGVAYAKL